MCEVTAPASIVMMVATVERKVEYESCTVPGTRGHDGVQTALQDSVLELLKLRLLLTCELWRPRYFLLLVQVLLLQLLKFAMAVKVSRVVISTWT